MLWLMNIKANFHSIIRKIDPHCVRSTGTPSFPGPYSV